MPLRRLTHMRTITGRHQHNPMIPQTATFWNVAIAQGRRWNEHVNYVLMKNQKLKIRMKIVRKKLKNINIHSNINLSIHPNIKSKYQVELRDAIIEA